MHPVRRDSPWGPRRADLAQRESLDGAYPELVNALTRDGPDLIADGEIVTFAGSQTSFAGLRCRMQIRDRSGRASGAGRA